MDFALPRKTKFGIGEDATLSYTYPGGYQVQATSDGGERLLLGPKDSQIALVSKLVECLSEPYRILYVLVVPRSDPADAARYEAPAELSRKELADFLAEYAEFFESDGRHHLWVANPEEGTIVYDRHNLIYAYGPIEQFVALAATQGMHDGPVEIPAPHWHAYHREYDVVQTRLLARWDWRQSPLRPNDEA